MNSSSRKYELEFVSKSEQKAKTEVCKKKLKKTLANYNRARIYSWAMSDALFEFRSQGGKARWKGTTETQRKAHMRKLIRLRWRKYRARLREEAGKGRKRT